jgi:4'-phosphopantetheinyl transferase
MHPTKRHITDADFVLAKSFDLPPNEVHLWRAEIDHICADEARWHKLLSAEEKNRAAGFHFPADRQRFAASRALLRMILSGYLSVDPSTIAFAYSSKEKPSLAEPRAASGLKFNLSHSGGVALFAFAREREIGVDIEQIRSTSDLDGIARRFFSVAEQQQFFAFPPEEKTGAFFRCWTRKEAYIKATGDGLSLPLSQFDVSLEADSKQGSPKQGSKNQGLKKQGSKNALLATRPDPSEAYQWHLRDVPGGPGFMAALCVRGSECAVRGWEEKPGEESF